MKHIRRAKCGDLVRIAEIEVFNYRLNFYAIFQNDWFYFNELQVDKLAKKYESELDKIWVYDDGVVKGFIMVADCEVRKLFVEPVLQGRAIGTELLEHAIEEENACFLWALEKNTRAIAFYRKHGFYLTTERRPEEDSTEYLIRMER